MTHRKTLLQASFSALGAIGFVPLGLELIIGVLRQAPLDVAWLLVGVGCVALGAIAGFIAARSARRLIASPAGAPPGSDVKPSDFKGPQVLVIVLAPTQANGYPPVVHYLRHWPQLVGIVPLVTSRSDSHPDLAAFRKQLGMPPVVVTPPVELTYQDSRYRIPRSKVIAAVHEIDPDAGIVAEVTGGSVLHSFALRQAAADEGWPSLYVSGPRLDGRTVAEATTITAPAFVAA